MGSSLRLRQYSSIYYSTLITNNIWYSRFQKYGMTKKNCNFRISKHHDLGIVLLEMVTTMLLFFCLFQKHRSVCLVHWPAKLLCQHVHGMTRMRERGARAGFGWSDESLLPLHYSRDCNIWACTSSSRHRYLGDWGTWSLFQGWCQEVVRLISRWSCWVRAGESLGAQLVCVSAGFKHSCCSLEAAEVAASKQAHQLISPLPPPTLHFATLPSSPLLQIPSYLFAQGLTSCTHNKFSREREIWNTSNRFN